MNRIEILENALLKCREKFSFYEKNHIAKGDIEKANVNNQMISMIDSVITNIDTKKYWYAFSYIGKTIDTDLLANACTYTGYSVNEITLKDIFDNKANAMLKSDATLINVSYLGYMTKEVFDNLPK